MSREGLCINNATKRRFTKSFEMNHPETLNRFSNSNITRKSTFVNEFVTKAFNGTNLCFSQTLECRGCPKKVMKSSPTYLNFCQKKHFPKIDWNFLNFQIYLQEIPHTAEVHQKSCPPTCNLLTQNYGKIMKKNLKTDPQSIFLKAKKKHF